MHSFDRAGSETSWSLYVSPSNQSTPGRTPHPVTTYSWNRSPQQRSPMQLCDDVADVDRSNLADAGRARRRFASTDPGQMVVFVMYASPLLPNHQPIDFESEIDRIVCSARDSGRLQTGQVRLNVGTATAPSLTKLLTLSHGERSGLILHLAAHGDEAGGLILEKNEGTGDDHKCQHEKLRKILQVGGRGLCGVSLVFLSSCSSKQLAQVFIDSGCQHAIATNRSVLDQTARAFTERFYHALFVGKSITSAFEHTKEALLASSQPEVADQSNAFILLTNQEKSEGCCSGNVSANDRPQFMDNLERPPSVLSQRDTDIEGFQEAQRARDKLDLLPSRVEDFFRPLEMKQVLIKFGPDKRRACAVHGPQGIGKTALGIELARFASTPGRLFSGNVLHVQFHHKSKAVRAMQKACDKFFMVRSSSVAEAPEGRDRVVWQLQQLELSKPQSERILLVLDDECSALHQSIALRGLLAEVLRKTHRVYFLFCSRSPLHESLGGMKVVNVDLNGLDERNAAKLLLQRVHRPLGPADLLECDSISQVRARGQLCKLSEMVKLIVDSKVLLPLAGNPGLIRHVADNVIPRGPPLRQVIQMLRDTALVPEVSGNSLQ